MFRNTGRYSELPGIENGYELDPYKSFFSIVLPTGTDKTNLATNPSLETGTTNWVAAGGSAIARDTTDQRFGLYSLKVTPGAATSDGAIYGSTTPFSLTAGTVYYASIWFKGTAGLKYAISFATTGFSLLGQLLHFQATGIWQRVSCIYAETVSTTRTFLVVKDVQTNISPFWVDGLQIEQDNLTTYIDGDQVGFVRGRNDYYWTGTAHASSSVRIGQSRHGGRVVPFADFGFHVTGILGLGMGGRVNQLLPIGRGGAYYGGSSTTDRQFALTGSLYGNNLPDLQRKRKQMIDIFKDDVVSPDQQMTLLYQQFDDDGNPVTPQEEIVCIVDGDPLVGKTDNLFSEPLALTFRLLNTWAMQETGNVATSLTVNASIANANTILKRLASGAWQAVGTGGQTPQSLGTVSTLVAQDGSIYFIGDNTTWGSVANTQGIAKWNGSAYSALGTGLAGAPGTLGYVIVQAADGTIYIGGNFTSAGGVANTLGVAKWNGTAWSALGTGGAITYGLAIGIDGTLYAVGDFNPMGGVANAKGVAKWNGSAWSALGTGLAGGSSAAYCCAIGKDGFLYIAGLFTTANGVTCNSIARWTGTTFAPLGSGSAGNSITNMAVGPDGSLYVAGTFGAIGGITANNIAKWNGSGWSALGAGVNAVVSPQRMGFIGNLLYIGQTSGDVVWNGSAYTSVDVSLPGTPDVAAPVQDRAGNAYLGFNTTGTATGPTETTVNNTGSEAAGVTLNLIGPGTVAALRNATTGKVIYFNLTLIASETAVLDLRDPARITFVSSARGNILGTIAPGSNPADFNLAPGNNTITILITGSTGATAAALAWRITHHGVDTALPVGLSL